MAAKDARLDVQVARVNGKIGDPALFLDPRQVKAVAKARNYGQEFYGRLGRIERRVEKGEHTHQPYEYLTTGRVVKERGLVMETGRPAIPYVPAGPPQRPAVPASTLLTDGLQKVLDRLSRSLSARTRTQDVRSEEEKQRSTDREYER